MMCIKDSEWCALVVEHVQMVLNASC